MDEAFRKSLESLSARERIAAIRKEMKITQMELARRTGSHWVTISRLENGKIELTHEWFVRLSKALEIEEDDVNPNYHENLVYKTIGEISKEGFAYYNGASETVTNTSRFGKKGFLFSFFTDDYHSIIQRGDIVRINSVRKDDWGYVIDRMCLVSTGIQNKFVFGTLRFPVENGDYVKDGSYYIVDAKENKLLDLPFDIVGVVTEILSTFSTEPRGPKNLK